MTERKGRMEPLDSFVDRQIREAMERGEFDALPGEGKPLEGLDAPHDDLWWVKSLMKREQLSFVPEVLEVRREVEKTLIAALSRTREQDVRRDVESCNARIRALNAHAAPGPASDLMPLDVDDVVARWRCRAPGR